MRLVQAVASTLGLAWRSYTTSHLVSCPRAIEDATALARESGPWNGVPLTDHSAKTLVETDLAALRASSGEPGLCQFDTFDDQQRIVGRMTFAAAAGRLRRVMRVLAGLEVIPARLLAEVRGQEVDQQPRFCREVSVGSV